MSAPTNREFLEAMFAGMPHGEHTILAAFECAVEAAGDREWRGQAWWPRQPLPYRFANHPKKKNTYVTVSSFVPIPAGQKQEGELRRKKAQFVSMHAAMIDDIGTAPQSKVLPDQLKLPPSALIETSPGNYQAFLFLQGPSSADRGRCERLIDRMIAAGLTQDGKDPGMKGVTRYGRLPVGINNKDKYVKVLRRPFEVRVESWAPERRYSVEEIAAGFGLDLTPAARPPPNNVAPFDIAKLERNFGAVVWVFERLKMVKRRLDDDSGWDVTCPWVKWHTGKLDTGAALFEPNDEDNHWQGGFKCHHGGCGERGMRDVRRWARCVRELMVQRRIEA